MEKNVNKYRGYRVMNGYKQSDIAEHLGIARQTYKYKESIQKFNTAEKKCLANLYNVKEEEFDGGN